jgi:hypothetical protein
VSEWCRLWLWCAPDRPGAAVCVLRHPGDGRQVPCCDGCLSRLKARADGPGWEVIGEERAQAVGVPEAGRQEAPGGFWAAVGEWLRAAGRTEYFLENRACQFGLGGEPVLQPFRTRPCTLEDPVGADMVEVVWGKRGRRICRGCMYKRHPSRYQPLDQPPEKRQAPGWQAQLPGYYGGHRG